MCLFERIWLNDALCSFLGHSEASQKMERGGAGEIQLEEGGEKASKTL